MQGDSGHNIIYSRSRPHPARPVSTLFRTAVQHFLEQHPRDSTIHRWQLAFALGHTTVSYRERAARFMTAPLFSVLIDTYNHERYIEEAVQSVLAQDFPASEREILVVDDGSTDRTPQILAKFAPQIRVLRKTNGGQASAFNHGIPECRGQLIAFLDGDDSWTPNKLKAACDVMAANPSVGMMGHAFDEVQAGSPATTIAPPQEIYVNLADAHAADIFRVHRPFFGTSRLVMRSHIARQCVPVPEALIFEADEYLFTLAAALAGGFVSAHALTRYRLHGESLFVAAGSSTEGLRRKQRVLEALATSLQQVLPRVGAPPDAVRSTVDIVNAEASQLRLTLDGGWSWEVVRVETAIYHALHRGAPWRSAAFRWLSMIPALLVPPRTYYRTRRFLAKHPWYSYFRRRIVPVPPITVPKSGAALPEKSPLPRDS